MTHLKVILAASPLLLVVASSGGCTGGKRGTEGADGTSSSGEERPAQQVVCGDVTCATGQVCCNPSCGICAAPDGMCTQEFCDRDPVVREGGQPPPPMAAVTACDEVSCESGTHCELVQVQCVRAPCDPVPQCKPDDEPDADASEEGAAESSD